MDVEAKILQAFEIYENVSFGARVIDRPVRFEYTHSGISLMYLIVIIAVFFVLFLLVYFLF